MQKKMESRVLDLEFGFKGDERGKLIPLEALSEQVPFEIKRTYIIFDTTPGTVRGKHAHRALRQVLVCVSGACTIVGALLDASGRADQKQALDLNPLQRRRQMVDGFVRRETLVKLAEHKGMSLSDAEASEFRDQLLGDVFRECPQKTNAWRSIRAGNDFDAVGKKPLRAFANSNAYMIISVKISQ